MKYWLPEVLTLDDLTHLRDRRDDWYPIVRLIAEDAGLPSDTIGHLDGSTLVAAIGRDHVIKLIPSTWRREYEAEVAALMHISGSAPVVTPEVHATGTFG